MAPVTKRTRWGEYTWMPKRVAMALDMSHECFLLHVSPYFVSVFVHLPFLQRWHKEPNDPMGDRWGFSFSDGDALHLNWGRKLKIIDMPWSYTWIETAMLLDRPVPSMAQIAPGDAPVELWAIDNETTRREALAQGRCAREVYEDVCKKRLKLRRTYTYRLSCGTEQNVRCTLTIRRTEWRQRWLKWTSWGNRRITYLDVEFDDEIGEGVGTWKGGVLSTSQRIRPGDSIEQTFTWMQRDRKFEV